MKLFRKRVSFVLNIFEEAVDFAKKIQKTEEFLNLKKAKQCNDCDEKLQDLIHEFNLLKIKLGQAGNEKSEEYEKNGLKLSEVYEKIMENENMIMFNKASDKMNFVMNRVNKILVAAVNDGDFEEINDQENCGGNCNGCSGCF